MIDPKKKVQELVALVSENEIVEFKEANNDYDLEKLGKYFSALSNEANLKGETSAWIVFGVADKSRMYINTRYRPTEPRLQSLKSEISKKTTSGITFQEIYELEVEPGKRVILFQIPPAPAGMPIAWGGFYYARHHEELTSLNIEKIERIRSQTVIQDWSKQLCAGATIRDLAPEAIDRARILYKRKNPALASNVDGWDDEKFLNKAKITIAGKITNTAILLLGRPESVHYISPAVSKISWILRDKDTVEMDYEHFTSPLILSIDKIYGKIRNLNYRYLQEGSLFPEEVSMYDPYVIREALNNCIAHQDYLLGGKINVVENDDNSLVFSNSGSFLPVRVENVIHSDSPSEFYRNRFLTDAMVSLSMIDTIGSGIKKMFISQKNKFFPLPEYDLRESQVTVTIIGKVLDLNYARKLAQIPELTLDDIILLDKVQKKKQIEAEEAQKLRSMGLIEGKRPNLYVSSKVADSTDLKVDYMKRRGIDNEYCKKIIVDYLTKFDHGVRADFEGILTDKLSNNLSETQKRNKVRNVIQALKQEKIIELKDGRTWILSE